MLSVEKIEKIPLYIREKINHQAYNDVSDCKDPSYPDEYYMECYYFWKSVDYEMKTW